MNTILETIVSSNIMNQSTAATSSRKHALDNRLTIIFQTNPHSSEPSAHTKEFFEQKNAAKSKAHLYRKLCIVLRFLIHLDRRYRYTNPKLTR